MTTAQDARTISACILRCANARDGRGRWRAVQDCRHTLAGGALVPSTLDDMCAASARRVGEWLRARVHADIGRLQAGGATPPTGHAGMVRMGDA